MQTLYVIFWCTGVASYLSSLVSSYLCVIFCALRLHAWPSCSVTANTQRPAFHYTIGLLQDSRNRIWNDVWWIRCRRRPLVGYVDWLVFGTWEKRTAKWLVDVKNLAAESGVIPRTLCLHLSECSGVLVRLFPVSAYRVYTGLLFPSTYRVSFKCPPTVCLSSVRLPCVFRVSAYRVSFECPPTFECPSVTSAYRTRALTVQCVSTYRVAHRIFSVLSDPGVLPCLHLCLRPTEEFSVPSEPDVLPWLHLCLTVRPTVLSVSVLMATFRVQPGRRAKQRQATSKPVCCIIF